MVEVATKASVGYKDEIWIGPVNGGTIVTEFIQVLGIDQANMPERTPDELDATHMQSPGFTKEYITGMLDAADFSQEMQYWPDDPAQIALEALAALNEASPRVIEDIYMEFVVGGKRRTYRANVRSFTPMSSVGAIRRASLNARVFERLATNPRTVA